MNELFKRWDELVTRPIHLWGTHDSAAEEGREEANEILDNAERARRHVRDRYIAARFPGVAGGSADLARVAHVIKSARTYLEDGNARLAEELLDLACLLHPQVEALWLARLELALRVRDAEGYRAAAFAYRQSVPESLFWPEAAALARSLCLTDDAFAAEGESTTLLVRRRDWLRTFWESAPEAGPLDVRVRVFEASHEKVAA